jgi:hypothetical protein
VNILLIEVVVLITIGWATTLWALKQKWMRERQAWQWWQTQQTLQSHHTAESIRDGLLQQTFAFRRYLETNIAENNIESDLSAQPKAEQTARWLERFQAFYQSLESLSNQLSPPFTADSLPLALQFVVKNWQKSHPTLTLQLSLPPDWSHSSRQNQAILSIVTGLLTLLIPSNSNAQQLQLALSSEKALQTLTLQIDGISPHDAKNIIASPEVQHLKEIFHSLTAGRLDINDEDGLLMGHLRWHDN